MSPYDDFMEIRSVQHLGVLVRQHRIERNWSQARLAEAAGVSRQWVVAFESGKPTAEIGNVLRTVRAIGLVLDLVEAGPDEHDLMEIFGA